MRQPLGDEWVVVMEWPEGVTDGGPARLIIEPVDKMPVGGLSSTVLRRIDFRDAVERHRLQLAQSRQTGDKSIFEQLRETERAELRRALTEDGVSDYYLAFLSWQYVQAAGTGQSNINDFLAEMVGKPVGTVRGHLIRARQKGLLTGSHGRKGGELTDAAEDLLEPYIQTHLAEFDRLRDLRAEDEPKRRRPQKVTTSRSKT